MLAPASIRAVKVADRPKLLDPRLSERDKGSRGVGGGAMVKGATDGRHSTPAAIPQLLPAGATPIYLNWCTTSFDGKAVSFFTWKTLTT